jgi:hypothetical protein
MPYCDRCSEYGHYPSQHQHADYVRVKDALIWLVRYRETTVIPPDDVAETLRWAKGQTEAPDEEEGGHASLLTELRDAGLIPKKAGCSCGCHDGSLKHAGPCRCQQ